MSLRALRPVAATALAVVAFVGLAALPANGEPRTARTAASGDQPARPDRYNYTDADSVGIPASAKEFRLDIRVTPA